MGREGNISEGGVAMEAVGCSGQAGGQGILNTKGGRVVDKAYAKQGQASEGGVAGGSILKGVLKVNPTIK